MAQKMIQFSSTEKERINQGGDVSVLKEQIGLSGLKEKYMQRPCAGLWLCFGELRADWNGSSTRSTAQEVRVRVESGSGQIRRALKAF